MDPDVVLLSRFQFGFTLAFHILFPTLTVGLATFLVFLETRWLRTCDQLYLRLHRFWTKIFALSFGMGVVSGIVISFEFGTNFSGFSKATGNVLGPLLSYEVLTAFFLEASFLPIMLFGWGRVSPKLHFFSTVMVALGTILSAFWILSANSWMQTPRGHAIRDGVFFVMSWFDVIFNPSFLYRLSHMLTASFLTAAFVVVGVSAWYLLRNQHVALARKGFSLSMWAALILAPTQIVLGDLHGLQVQRDQPMKVAAMEALWETRRYAPFTVFAIPDMEAEMNHWELSIPYASSLILQHDPAGLVLGLNEVPPAERPYVPIVFFSFRIMLFVGFFFLAMALIGLVLRLKGRLYGRPWFLWLCVFSIPLGFIAVIAGWFVVETGRQPWIVYEVVKTANTASDIPFASVVTSVSLFVVVYNFLLLAFLFFGYRILKKGPEEAVPKRLREHLTVWFPTME